MTPTEIGSLMSGAGFFGTMLIGAYNAFRSGKRDEKIEQIHAATDGMKDALVAATAKTSKAEGVVEGLAQGMAET